MESAGPALALTTAIQRPPARLAAEACRDEASLRSFVEDRISVNAWPIHCRPLRRLIHRRGLDLAAARDLDVPLASLAELMRRMYAGSRRAERMRRVDNAFHHTLHNFEVCLRLLLLEWPPRPPVPEAVRHVASRAYDSFEQVEPVLLDLLRRLLESGVASWRLARGVLAALGHDYGHLGGNDRLDGGGRPLPLTHEEASEKHAAKFGIACGLPPALILESMAGIRATTLHVRRGRQKVVAATDFERRLALADVTGCVMRPDLWMTRVAIPVLRERLMPWKRRRAELPGEIRELKRRLAERPDGEAARSLEARHLARLEAEDRAILRTVTQAIRSELRFLTFVRTQRLAPVPAGRRLWRGALDHRIGLVERQLARTDLLAPLDALGFAFVEEMATKLSNVASFRQALESSDVHPNLRQLYDEFLPR